MACKPVCKICPHFIAARTVTYASGVLTINIPAGTYNDGEKYCLVVADRIPTDAIIGAPVVVTIGSSTVSYPLLRCNGAQVVAGNLRSRYRYSTVFSTNVAGGGAFRLLGKVFCCETNTPSGVTVAQ